MEAWHLSRAACLSGCSVDRECAASSVARLAQAEALISVFDVLRHWSHRGELNLKLAAFIGRENRVRLKLAPVIRGMSA